MSVVTKIKFRESFKFPIYFMPNVFSKVLPFHMAKGMSAMRGKTNNCDCIIEIRDARVPISSCNPQFEYLYAHRQRIVLMNKIDLANEKVTKAVVKKFIENDNTKVIYTNCRVNSNKGVRSIMTFINELIHNENMEINAEPNIHTEVKEKTYKALVCGIPNVGKSSFINSARQQFTSRSGKATRVGKIPGVTRSVLNTILISMSPRVMILDTPGILPPEVLDPITGIKLALTGTFPDHVIGEEVIADYLLYVLNKQNNKRYLSMCGLNGPSDDFDHVILSLSSKLGLTRKDEPDYRKSSIKFISAFRKGKFGRMTLD